MIKGTPKMSEARKRVLDFGTPVKVYLDRRFFGEEVYVGKGKIAGRIVYGEGADYAVDLRGEEGVIFIGTASLEPGIRCFRIKTLKKKKENK